MKLPRIILRSLVTLLVLGGLVAYIARRGVGDAFSGSVWGWILVGAGLFPLFVVLRMGKWTYLVRQVVPDAALSTVAAGYLWGMALGLLTPGRLGELARVQDLGAPGRCSGLFLLEKVLEVLVLLALCAVALLLLGFLPWWTGIPLGGGLLLAARSWRRLLVAGARLAGRRFSRLSPDQVDAFSAAVAELRIGACVALSLSCFLIFALQVTLLLRGMGASLTSTTVLLIFPVLLANLLPITVGGYGVRESVAVVLLANQGISAPVAASAFAATAFFDLVIPGLLGAVFHVMRPKLGRSTPPVPSDQGSTPSAPPDDWDAFWQERRARPLGRIVAWGRARFVTSKLVRYVLANTPKGVLVEAGCGSGEVSLKVAQQRGDRVILVDRIQHRPLACTAGCGPTRR